MDTPVSSSEDATSAPSSDQPRCQPTQQQPHHQPQQGLLHLPPTAGLVGPTTRPASASSAAGRLSATATSPDISTVHRLGDHSTPASSDDTSMHRGQQQPCQHTGVLHSSLLQANLAASASAPAAEAAAGPAVATAAMPAPAATAPGAPDQRTSCRLHSLSADPMGLPHHAVGK
jgi:hypothetical protein